MYVSVLLTFALAACGVFGNREIYEHLFSLDNFDVRDTPLVTSSVRNGIDCAKLCFEESRCLYYKVFDGTCSLYVSTPQPAGTLQGAVYFTKYADTCPISKGFLSVSSPRLCFKLSKSRDTRQWTDCQIECQSQGGRLMILNTADKQNYIAQYLTQNVGASYNVWVGMTQENSVFTWTDGTTKVDQWSDGEPDYVSYQNCVQIMHDGMSDIECEAKHIYLCEIVLPQG